ncbi:hypothetical protein ml_375 [Mollivirus sibericum]|uniref:hypothetical protein n=1 Tax=Mollivirus sibericum TaxID=1678078 RepID=UPI0006B2EECA|nr:hypothetical protein ml_375 [Mollivirus sibericum]ALD62177.1 hypothetical protein ml_375 [Mollivirus sibericum]
MMTMTTQPQPERRAMVIINAPQPGPRGHRGSDGVALRGPPGQNAGPVFARPEVRLLAGRIVSRKTGGSTFQSGPGWTASLGQGEITVKTSVGRHIEALVVTPEGNSSRANYAVQQDGQFKVWGTTQEGDEPTINFMAYVV